MIWASIWGDINSPTASIFGSMWIDYGGTAPGDFLAADFDSGDFDT